MNRQKESTIAHILGQSSFQLNLLMMHHRDPSIWYFASLILGEKIGADITRSSRDILATRRSKAEKMQSALYWLLEVHCSLCPFMAQSVSKRIIFYLLCCMETLLIGNNEC